MFESDKAGPKKQGALVIASGTTFTVRYEVLVHKGRIAGKLEAEVRRIFGFKVSAQTPGRDHIV